MIFRFVDKKENTEEENDDLDDFDIEIIDWQDLGL